MKKLLAILLLFSLAFQCFSQLGVWLGYEIHKDYIASTLCVNRDKPEMHCDGRCYLQKKLRQDEQQKHDENGVTGNKIEMATFCNTSQQPVSLFLTVEEMVFPPVHLPPYRLFYKQIPHPPRV